MEGLSLLKYWRSGGGTTGASSATTKNTTTIATTVLRQSTDSDVSIEEDEEGPFFDLDFAVPDEEEEDGGSDIHEDEEIEVTASPSDGLFFKGRLVQLESAASGSLFLDDNAGKHHQFLAGSLLKSATKFRLFPMKGPKKPKSVMPAVVDPTVMVGPSSKLQHHGSKFFAVKFKMEDVPIMSLFIRDNSSRSSGKGVKQSGTPDEIPTVNVMVGVGGGKTPKDVVDKYINKIKPLYIKVSRRSNGEKCKPSGKTKLTGNPPEKLGETKTSVEKKATTTHLPNRVHNGLRAVKKHLGKSRLASSAVAAVPSTTPAGVISRHRDDSLVQQHDGIQSAIAHCKRSFNATAGGLPWNTARRRMEDCI